RTRLGGVEAFELGVERREDARSVRLRVHAVLGEPSYRLVRRQGTEVDLRSTATRPGDRWVQRADLLVRRYEHEHAQALPDQPVDDVQEAREALADDRLCVGRQQLAGVLQHEQPPALRRAAAA